MAIVLDAKDNLTVLGVVTLEDVIEELLEAEVWDEKDIPNIPHRPELHDILQSPQPTKSGPPSIKKFDEKNPLISLSESRSGTSSPYKYYGSIDVKEI